MKNIKHLSDHLVRTVNLPEFIEVQGGVNLSWTRDDLSAVCPCPMPDHEETKPSFHINYHNDVWKYHCFGCGKKGTIIQFCIDFFDMKYYDAIKFLIDHYEIENVDDLILKGLMNVSKHLDLEKKIEHEHISTSNICRMLLRKDMKKHSDWVVKAYERLNVALDEGDYDIVRGIGSEAMGRVRL